MIVKLSDFGLSNEEQSRCRMAMVLSAIELIADVEELDAEPTDAPA